jgi:hypothetical protein
MSPEKQFEWEHPWPAAMEFSGEMLAAQFAELSARPDPERCDRLLHDLSSALALVKRARDRLLNPDDPLIR